MSNMRSVVLFGSEDKNVMCVLWTQLYSNKKFATTNMCMHIYVCIYI